MKQKSSKRQSSMFVTTCKCMLKHSEVDRKNERILNNVILIKRNSRSDSEGSKAAKMWRRNSDRADSVNVNNGRILIKR
jgi:hypothetical protein